MSITPGDHSTGTSKTGSVTARDVPRPFAGADFLLSKGWRRDDPVTWISPITGTRYSLAAALSLYGR